jgi:hypothetical protein
MKKQTILRIFLVVFTLFFLSVNVFGVIWANDTDTGFDDPGGGKAANITIRQYVIEGAGYFLDAYSDTLLFLNKIELAELNGVDYTELSLILTRAIDHMTDARTTYINLKQKADQTPYNQHIITELMNFNYNEFQQVNALNIVIFEQVTGYLKKGDIRGIYNHLLLDIEDIFNLLIAIKAEVDSHVFPGISNIWQLNHTSSQSLVFGQYVSMVFHDILERDYK